MDVATSESTNSIVKMVLESKEFKRAVDSAVDNAIEAAINNIDASDIDGIEDAVEKVINNGTFEASTDISFSS